MTLIPAFAVVAALGAVPVAPEDLARFPAYRMTRYWQMPKDWQERQQFYTAQGHILSHEAQTWNARALAVYTAWQAHIKLVQARRVYDGDPWYIPTEDGVTFNLRELRGLIGPVAYGFGLMPWPLEVSPPTFDD